MTVAVRPLLPCPLVVPSPKVPASAPPIRNVLCRRSQSSQLISGLMDRTLLLQKLLSVSRRCVHMRERWKRMEATAESNRRFYRTDLVFLWWCLILVRAVQVQKKTEVKVEKPASRKGLDDPQLWRGGWGRADPDPARPSRRPSGWGGLYLSFLDSVSSPWASAPTCSGSSSSRTGGNWDRLVLSPLVLLSFLDFW